MATRGRKPLPTALKELEGDRGKGRRPLNKDEPTPPQDNVKCPAWLMPEAKKEWKRLAPSLIAMGVARPTLGGGKLKNSYLSTAPSSKRPAAMFSRCRRSASPCRT